VARHDHDEEVRHRGVGKACGRRLDPGGERARRVDPDEGRSHRARADEAAVVVNCDAKVFAMASSRITGPEMLRRRLHNQDAIHRWARRTPPPFVAGVYENRISRLRLATLDGAG
jgi:hypothetical protein